MREETTSPYVSQTQNYQNHQNHQNSGSMLKHFLSLAQRCFKSLTCVFTPSWPEKRGAPSAFIRTKSPAEAEMMWTSWGGTAVARARRSNEDIYLPGRRACTPSARAPNIDQRRRQSPAAQRSNSILSEERRRNYRAAAERADHLHSGLLIADNHRMKNVRKSSRRRQRCWLNVRSAESTLKTCFKTLVLFPRVDWCLAEHQSRFKTSSSTLTSFCGTWSWNWAHKLLEIISAANVGRHSP